MLLVMILGTLLVLWSFEVPYGAYLVLAAWCCTGFILLLRRRRDKTKKPLIYTGRAIRILILALGICTILAGAFGLYLCEQGIYGLGTPNEYRVALFVLMGGFIIIQFAPAAVSLSNVLLLPLQTTINRLYLITAKKRLARIGPLVVGITGSYGKTSTKHFLEVLLGERYRTLKTPLSFNTLMGVCRVINENLRPEHEVFLVEMGAYRPNDIRELADFVHPTIGIITAIGPQHLERFKTIESIEATKYELIECLPKSGAAIFNNDDPRCRKLADRTTGKKVRRYGIDSSWPGLRVWAKEITQTTQGLSLTLVDSEGNYETAKTVLLGRHNVSNILGAACAALELGLTLKEISAAIPKIQPILHRLQPVRGKGGVTVIDDSYNSNPVGAMEALHVLNDFKTGKRVLVTPGMVELGENEDKCNEEFGAEAAKICDYVLLVGVKQTQAILKGLEREKFSPERIRLVKDLDEATRHLQNILHAGDVVLFENDLPDLYIEA
ncbi:MAG: Mur ligase family protein [Deltaproteobacteria bacterium]|nr:Mur ligase family protein [Deltaproteobacteria bacterium]